MYITLAVAVLSVLVIGTSGGGSSTVGAGEAYWNNVLPKTSMPKAIKDLLPDKVLPRTNTNQRNKASNAKVLPSSSFPHWNAASNAKVLPSSSYPTWNRASNADKVLPRTNTNQRNKASTAKVLPSSFNNKRNAASNAKVLPLSSFPHWNAASKSNAKVLPLSSFPHWNAAASNAKVLPLSSFPHWNAASNAKALPLSSFPHWNRASNAGEGKFRYDPTITTVFLVENLRPGKKMTLSFPDTSVYGVTFISNTQSNSIPFSSSKLPDILSFFSINSDSALASAMKETLATCEYKQMEGEKKHCATSLESMVDFTTSVLKTDNLISISTTTDKESTSKQEYEVTSSYLKSSGDNTVVCHAQTFAYAVFYCHKLKGVDVFDVEMVGADRTKVKAVATCHTDTSKWNPNNFALRTLNVKPGTVPVCHILPQYDVLWIAT